MNRYKLVLIVSLLAAALLTSCDDYLDLDVKGKVTEADIQTNINNLNVQLAAVYSQLAKNDFERSLYRFGEMPGDQVTMQTGDYTDANLQLATFSAGPTNEHLLTFWKACYAGIKAANDYLSAHEVVYTQWMEKVDEIYETSGGVSPLFRGQEGSVSDIEVLTKKELTYMAGEARFLRALFYFYLVRTFGDVPVMPEKLVIDKEGNNFYQDRTPVDSVYSYIEKDLRMAMATCRPALFLSGKNELHAGRATNAAAAAYLLKVIGYQASRGETERWAEIPPISRWIYSGDEFTFNEVLAPSFSETSWEILQKELYLFKYDSIAATERINKVSSVHKELFDRYDMLNWVDNEFNKEILFSINHAYTGDGTANNNNRGTVIWHDLYNMGDRDTEAVPGSKLYSASNKYSSDYGISTGALRDPRWASTTLGSGFVPFYEGIAVSNNFSNPTASHRTITKYFVNKQHLPQNRENSDYPRNVILMRLAEVWLWEAEALNEMGNSAEAIGIVNKIRTRANRLKTETAADSWDYVKAIVTGNTGDHIGYVDAADIVLLEPLPVFSKAINREAIWRERGIELCFEFDRFYDLVRTDQIQEASLSWNLFDGVVIDITPKSFTKGVNEIFPIPQEEIYKAGGRWIQNPGY